MDRRNFYYKQLVTDGELDEAFDDVEQGAELNTVMDAGMQWALPADAPRVDQFQFGGIIKGCVVARDGTNDYVTVTAGVIRDYLGRRIEIPACTVKITNVGPTLEGVSSNATGTGAAITGSCGGGNRIVCSLFLCYDEHESDDRVDGLLAHLNYDLVESFHFDLQVAAAFPNPPIADPGQPALPNDKCLLADLVLTNSAGAMQVITNGVCNSDADWNLLGTWYENLYGRRADWISLDQCDDFPQNAVANFSGLRARSARWAFYNLVKQLQAEVSSAGSPAGAELIGARVRAANGSVALQQAADDYSSSIAVVAGPLDSQLLTLLNLIDRKVGKGPGIVQPFYDDFMYAHKAANWDPATESKHWGLFPASAGSLVVRNDYGGVLRLTTSVGVPNEFTGLQTGLGATGALGWWKLNGVGGTPRPCCAVRIKSAAAGFAHGTINFGFIDLTNSGLLKCIIDCTAGAAIQAIGKDSAGVDGSLTTSIGTLVSNTWKTLFLVGDTDSTYTIWEPGGLSHSGTLVGTFGAGQYAFYILATTDGAANVELDIDVVSIGGGVVR